MHHLSLGGVGGATPTTHRLTAWGLRAVELLQYASSLSRGSVRCNSCNALPHPLGAAGNATPATHCLNYLGQWALQLL